MTKPKQQRNEIIVKEYHSPCGILRLGSLGDALCLCDWQVEKHSDSIDRRLKRILKADFRYGTTPVIEDTLLQLDEYFSGKRKEFNINIIFAGTDFQKKVWAELQNIPYGATTSYAELSKRIGISKAVRAVANANGANALSIIVPCHRVIGSDKSLTGYGGGLGSKKFLLELEGFNR